MSGKALNKQEMDSIDLAKFVFAFAVIHIHAGGRLSENQDEFSSELN